MLFPFFRPRFRFVSIWLVLGLVAIATGATARHRPLHGTNRAASSPNLSNLTVHLARPWTGYIRSPQSKKVSFYNNDSLAFVEFEPVTKSLIHCEILESRTMNDTKAVLDFMKTQSKLVFLDLPKMLELMDKCQNLNDDFYFEIFDESNAKQKNQNYYLIEDETGSASSSPNTYGFQRPRPQKRPRPSALRPQSQQSQETVRPASSLSLLMGIAPGTKWCGAGDLADNYFDLGRRRQIDKCCRTHDLCPIRIKGYDTRFNVTNDSMYTRLHCDCDIRFFKCLKARENPIADLIGHLYFNLLKASCLKLRNNRSLLVPFPAKY